MPDWQKLVCQRLSRLDLEAAEKQEVCAELAAHLEEDYQSSLRQGISEQAAIHRALQHVTDWQDLKAKIESSRSKELPMNKRVSQFWFPAFLTLLLSMLLLMLMQKFGPDPVMIEPTKKLRVTPVAVVYVAWLLTLPFIGALGAYLSLRAGGTFRSTLWSVVFPVLPYLAFFVVALPLTIIFDDYVAHHITIPAFFVGLSAWVIFPATALLAGGLPVHYFSSRLGARGTAIG